MASLTIRNLDDDLKYRLRLRAARGERSMEEEARRILRAALLGREPVPGNIADAVAAITDPVGGIELDLPPRTSSREPPRFDSAEYGPEDDGGPSGS